MKKPNSSNNNSRDFRKNNESKKKFFRLKKDLKAQEINHLTNLEESINLL